MATNPLRDLGNILGAGFNSAESIKPRLGTRPKIFTYLRTRQENLNIVEITADVEKSYIFDSFILGHSINGILGAGDILDNMDSSSGSWTPGADVAVSDEAVILQVGAGSLQLDFSATGAKTVTSTQSYGDLSSFTGVANGTPSQGTIGMWWYAPDTTSLTGIKLRIGSASGDYIECTGKEYTTSDTYYTGGALSFTSNVGWNYYLFDLDSPDSTVGIPDWTATDYTRFEFTVAANHTGYIDYFTISSSNFIGLNGLGERSGGADSTIRRVNPSNTYVEVFNNDTFKHTNTTADWAVTAGQCDFTVGEIAESEIFALNDEVYTSATLVAEGTTLTNLSFEVQFDGSTWETITNGATLTAANPSNAGLKFRVTAAGNATLTKVQVVYST